MAHFCRMRFLAVSATLALVPLACSAAPAPTASVGPTVSPTAVATPPRVIRYVALGDSYTIGTGISEPQRWPNQLVERLRPEVTLDLVGNLGVNGYTSDDLIAYQLPDLSDLRPDFVSLLIGVNDVVQGVPESEYRANLATTFGALLDAVPRDRIVVVSTPDYTLTPRGSGFGNPVAQRSQIVRFNAILADFAAERGVAFVDISAVADEAGSDPALLARDQLHPSGLQYERWVDLIAPIVSGLFGSGAGSTP